MEKKHVVKENAKELRPTVWLGKKGITESQIDEIKKQLKIRKVIKVKLLRSIQANEDRKSIALQLVEKTDAVLIDIIGSIIVLQQNPKDHGEKRG